MNARDPVSDLTISESDLRTTFCELNEKYFYGKLDGVKISWNRRLTRTAGKCAFKRSSNACEIRLSEPLLKQRQRKDFIDTLLHEMIHAFLFLTPYTVKGSAGHGPIFKAHMNRINKSAGTNITIYHSYHAEVALLKQHWWCCDGPCQKMGPNFGYIKRATNRAPCPTDFFWKKHEMICGGKFIKVHQPITSPPATSPIPTKVIKRGITKKKLPITSKQLPPLIEKNLPPKFTKSPPLIVAKTPTKRLLKPYLLLSSDRPSLVPYEISSDEEDDCVELIETKLSIMELSPNLELKNTSTT